MALKDLFLSKKEKVVLDAQDEILKIEAKKSADVAELDEMLIALDVELKAAEDKGFDLGLAQAGVPASDKIYTEADLQAEKELVAQPLKAQIALLDGKVADLQSLVDQIPSQIQVAIDAKIAEVVADYEAAQIDDNAFLAKYKK